MAENEDRWGKMKSYYEDGDMTNVSKIMGISENHPRFVDGPDSRMWEDIWRKEAEDAGFEYVHGQGRFDKNSERWTCLEKGKLGFYEDQMADILKRYNSSAIRYNEEIADPLEERRRFRLGKILEDVDAEEIQSSLDFRAG